MGAVLTLIALVHMEGCSSLGPRTLQRSHINYNKAVQKAQMEEDLLNIVRLRYYDMPVFLNVSSISAQPSFSVGTGGEFGLVEGNSSANITPDINYTDRPTITFVPSRDPEIFARQIPLDTFVRLAASQARFDILLRVAVANLNGIRNHFNIASPEFDRLAAKFMELKLRHDLEAGFVYRPTPLSEPIAAGSVDASTVLDAAREGFRFRPMKGGKVQLVGGESIPVLWVDPDGEGVQELLEELRLSRDHTNFPLKNAKQIEPPTQH